MTDLAIHRVVPLLEDALASGDEVPTTFVDLLIGAPA